MKEPQKLILTIIESFNTLARKLQNNIFLIIPGFPLGSYELWH